MAKKDYDFDEEDQGGVFDQIFGIVSHHKKAFAVVTVTAAVLLLGVVIASSYPGSDEQAAADSVPIVRADAGDYKVRPDNPGGMEIPYRDSTVFSSGDQAAPGTENILADDSAEEPVSRDAAFAGLNTNADQPGGAPVAEVPPRGELSRVEPILPPSNEELVQQAIGTDQPSAAQAGSGTETAAALPMPEPTTPAPVEEGAPAPVAKAETPAAEPKDEAPAVEPAAGTTAAKVTPGGSYVQLASVKDPSGAAREYKKMQAKYSALSGVDYRTQAADLGAKGTFHRIQAGPMSKESAGKVCAAIKSAGGSCLVVGK